MGRVTAAQARRDFSDVINRAAYGKERMIITRHDADLVAVVPIEEVRLMDAARQLLAANPALAADITAIDVARESQAAWGRVNAEIDTLTLASDSYDAVVDMLAHPQPSTQALRDLMNPSDVPIDED